MKRSRKLNEIMGGAQGKCTYPGCNHVCNLLTRNHVESAHGITREELYKRYGEPTILTVKPRRKHSAV